MSDLNKVTMIGDVVNYPKSEGVGSRGRLARLTLATSYTWEDSKTRRKHQEVAFHDVTAWGRLGEIIQQYVKKGSKLYVEGRLRKRRMSDGRAAAEIVADNMIMLGHRNQPSREETAT